jgi:hypothetical protein
MTDHATASTVAVIARLRRVMNSRGRHIVVNLPFSGLFWELYPIDPHWGS